MENNAIRAAFDALDFEQNGFVTADEFHKKLLELTPGIEVSRRKAVFLARRDFPQYGYSLKKIDGKPVACFFEPTETIT